MTKKQYLIPCECGHRKWLLKTSTFGNFPGRYYYRCPDKNDTCMSIWADELFSDRYKRLHPLLIETDDAGPPNRMFAQSQNDVLPETDGLPTNSSSTSSRSQQPNGMETLTRKPCDVDANVSACVAEIRPATAPASQVVVVYDRTGHCCCFVGSILFTISIFVLALAFIMNS